MGWLALVAKKKKKSSNDRWLPFTQTQPEQHTHTEDSTISLGNIIMRHLSRLSAAASQ